MKQFNLSQALDNQLSGVAGIGLEDNDVVLNVDIERPVDEEGVPVDTADTPEAEIVDAQQEEAEVADTEDKLDTLQDTEESLEAIQADIARFAAKGGMTADVADVMHARINDVTSRAGISIESYLPSLEAYGGSANQYATTVSLEATIKESLKSFWKWITETVSKLWTKLKDFLIKIVSAARKLNVRAKAILEQTRKLTGNAKEAELKGGIATAAYVEGSTQTAAADNLATLAKSTLDVGPKAYAGFVAAAGAGTIEAALAIEKGEAKLDVGSIKKIYAGFGNAVTNTKVKSPNAGIPYLRGNPLFGGKAFVLSDASAINEGNLTGKVADGGFVSKFINSVGEVASTVRQLKADCIDISGGKSKAAKSVKVASVGDLQSIAARIVEATEVAHKYELNYVQRNTATDEIIKFAKSAATDAKEAETENVQAIKANGKLALVIWQSVGQIERVAVSTVVSQSKVGLEYVVACIKQYGGEAAPAKKEGEEPAKKDGE